MQEPDVIVIGSGIGGLSCASALCKFGHRVLVLEQHYVAGGFTHTFSRNGYTWDIGVHYLGDMGARGQAAKILAWIADGQIRMAPIDEVYDRISFPEFEIGFSGPEAALKQRLIQHFPASRLEIAAFFSALRQAEKAGHALFALRAMPKPLSRLIAWLKRNELRKWWGTTTEAALGQLISDPALRAVLCSQWADYGATPSNSSFGMHSTVFRHYLGGGYYPVGGAGSFAAALVPAIEKAGGHVRVSSPVREIVFEDATAVGVGLEDGTIIRAGRIVSGIGAHRTVSQLLPEAFRRSDWGREILTFKPSLCHIALYLGFDGEIRQHGATASNYWFYETWDIESAIWNHPDQEPVAPLLFVSFPSLKDPEHLSNHTAVAIAMTDWEAFSQWQDSKPGNRPESYLDFKSRLEQEMLTRFRHHFPKLKIRYHELSTPLSTVSFTKSEQGSIYGLECSPRRFLSGSLDAKTPLSGLYLAGQDIVTPGVTGAMMGGILAAAAIEPRVFGQIRKR